MRSAAIVIARSGADGARMKDVADEAGVSLGLVQHYFGTRSNLVESTFQTMMDLSLRRWDDLSALEPDPLIRLIAGLRLQVYGPVAFHDRWGFWVELWSHARRHESIARIAHQVYGSWTQPFCSAVEQLERAGIATPVRSAEESALLLMSLIDGMALRVLVDRTVLTPDDMLETLIDATRTLFALDPDAVRSAARAAAKLVRVDGLESEPSTTEVEIALLKSAS